MIDTNLHTHTVFCDGKNTPEEMVKAAIDLGFSSLGFSVHSPMDFENDWACREEDLDECYNTIESLKQKYKDEIVIYNGIELDKDHTEIDLYKYDYVIAGLHQLKVGDDICEIDNTKEIFASNVKKHFGGDYLAFAKEYYSQFASFIIDVKPDIVAHFDLIEKFNDDRSLFDSASLSYKLMVQLYLEKICFSCPDTIFEVNTGAMQRLGNKRPYPAPFIMKILKKLNMRITISSDSHSVDSLNYKFDEMISYCKKYGFNEIYVLKDGKFTPQEI